MHNARKFPRRESRGEIFDSGGEFPAAGRHVRAVGFPLISMERTANARIRRLLSLPRRLAERDVSECKSRPLSVASGRLIFLPGARLRARARANAARLRRGARERSIDRVRGATHTHTHVVKWRIDLGLLARYFHGDGTLFARAIARGYFEDRAPRAGCPRVMLCSAVSRNRADNGGSMRFYDAFPAIKISLAINRWSDTRI